MNWYYLDNGTQRGPITDADFGPLTQQGVITAATHLWCEGMTDWKTYGELTGTPAAQATAVATAVAEPVGGLRVKQEQAPARSMDVGCTTCGTIVPRASAVVVGTSTLCPTCAAARQRTTVVGGDYAPPAMRIIAYIVDWILVAIVFFAGLNIVKYLLTRVVQDRELRGTVGIIIFGLMILWAIDYFSGRVARNGATFGQSMLGLRVVGPNGGNIGFLRAIGRFFAMLLINQFTLSLAQLVAFFDSQKRCLHDIICGTVVLKK